MLQKELKTREHYSPYTIKGPILTTPRISFNYSKEEISKIFNLKWYQFSWVHKENAKKLFDLGLSANDSIFLHRQLGLSLSEIQQLIGDYKLDVTYIRKCSISDLRKIPQIIQKLGFSWKFQELIGIGLSVNDIWELLPELTNDYSNIKSLLIHKYSVSEIKSFSAQQYSWVQLVQLIECIPKSDIISLYQEDKQNIKFLLLINEIANNSAYLGDQQNAIYTYQSIMKAIPNKMCEALIAFADEYCNPNDHNDDTNKDKYCNPNNPNNDRYEDILMRHMDFAAGKIPMIQGYIDTIPLIYKGIELLFKTKNLPAFDFFIEFIPVKPFILIAIWLHLDIALSQKYFADSYSCDIKTIGRFLISFILSSLCGVTGYFHSGGIGLPFNPTKYMNIAYKSLATLEEYIPTLYKYTPSILRVKEFNNLIKDHQIDAGRAMSMIYTFRVGDTFLRNIIRNNVFSEDAAEEVFKSLWPLPQEVELQRMYLLYSGMTLYTDFDWSSDLNFTDFDWKSAIYTTDLDWNSIFVNLSKR